MRLPVRRWFDIILMMAPTVYSSPTAASGIPRKPRSRGLLSKLIRSAALAAGEEVVASTITRVKEDSPGFTSRVPKMAVYGALIDTTVTHLLFKCLGVVSEKMRGSIGPTLQLVLTFIIVTPIQKLTRLIMVAYTTGAKTYTRLKKTVKRVFLPSLAALGFLAPAMVAFAQIFLPEGARPLFFQYMALFIRVFDNVLVKKALRKIGKKEREREGDNRRTSRTSSSVISNDKRV
ncbi:uncharacterized protein F5Z01DRAFT_657564 [Emericellopsis atlantica]|uniref:Uncharacterized protein n=1 Tax=Emericellopsis atlantica TaxID=2614577 RepID=A0A9P7ZKT3_9HYPO|nr:uncharacterized protein F5Z01DRAFT_657564 [Emericellopsis atlantica]KAG9253567.1 hypothetical protein F5Z01DRAFT_657564 [Emericellopsis atlantica]